MARPRKITVEQILKAAQAVFLEKGFGASTNEIATRAGISEGSIFKRFSTKEDLFLAAMGMSKVSNLTQSISAMAGQGDLKANLKQIETEMIDFFQEMLPKMMMVRSKGLPIPAMIVGPGKAPPVRLLKKLTAFFEEEMSLGRVRQDNPQTIAMLFMGSVTEYLFLSQIAATLPEREEYIDSAVEILWRSIRPLENEE